jgi:hypothetical protein
MSRVQPLLTKDGWLNPIWVVRGLPIGGTLFVALAFFIKRPTFQGAFLGAALGLLLSYCVFSFQIKGVVLKDTPQPSDVQKYPITR